MDNLPDFETPQPSTEPKVRKPRSKPQRKHRAKKTVVVAPKKRVAKKRRARRTFTPKPQPHGVFTAEARQVIDTLVRFSPADRNLIFTMVRELTK